MIYGKLSPKPLKRSALKTEMGSESREQLLEAFLTCRLILLDKSPGLKPIGKEETYERFQENLWWK